MRAVRRAIDQQVTVSLHVYRTWRSPKTASKRRKDYDRRCAVQAANIKAKEERAKAAR